MSERENRKPQQGDEQKPGQGQRSGNLPGEQGQKGQQDQQGQSGQPKNPQSEHRKNDQDKKKQA